MAEKEDFIDSLCSVSPALADWYQEQVNFNRAVLRHCRAMEKALCSNSKDMFEIYRRERIRLFHLDEKI